MTPADVLREARGHGLTVSIARSGNLYVEPAERLAPELHALLAANKAELLDHLRHATNDHGDDVAAWTRRRHATGREGVDPATLARFARASADLDRQIAEAGRAADPDRWCWPHSSAMATVEIERFTSRVMLFMRRGLDGAQADELADRLVIRDREGDDRACCAECRHARAQACPSGSPLPLAILHHCGHVQPA